MRPRQGDAVPCPRVLPVVYFAGESYIVDERLREFRPVPYPYLPVRFDSDRGKAMLGTFYVDTCPSCRQEIAISQDEAATEVRCRVCGARVLTQRP